MASLSLKGIQKIYPNGFHAVKDFNLDIEDKEFIIFVGPSGCGKSTTLRMIARLEDISGGTLEIDGKVMNDVEPKDRDIAMVFQNYALYPHMTVSAMCIRDRSRDGKTKIHAVKWIPEGKPVCILQIVHGMAEYIERYERLSSVLTRQGILVTGEDHLGHGKSVGENGIYGYFCAHGWIQRS